MENIKKYKFSILLALISIVLIIFYFSLPSKDIINEIEVKTNKNKVRTVNINTYYIENGTLKPYVFETEENLFSILLTNTVNDIIFKSKLNDNNLKLLNTYFSDTDIYFEFNTKNLNPLLKESINKTIINLIGDINVNYI